MNATPPPTTGGRLIYAVGDVHGRYDLLKRLLGEIALDAARRSPAERPVLVFCGDYVDRGPQSAEVLETVVWLKQRDQFEVRALKGNHEQALLLFLDQPEQPNGWIRFGGMETLLSYGVTPPRVGDDPAAFVRARDELAARMPASHRRLLEELERMVVIGDYAFVHAGVRPGIPLADQDDDDLLWIRDGFLDAAGPFEKVIVHGHTRHEAPQVMEHRLGIDTGAYATGVLTAARLDDEGMAIFSTSQRPIDPDLPELVLRLDS